MADWMSQLNPAQKEAVAHRGGPLLILAGAGTGKTNTLAARVAELVHRGIHPARILLLTFTRRAAREMLDRAARFIGQTASAQVVGGTFHAVAHRLLRQHASAIGLPHGFSVMDQADAADLMNLLRTELRLAAGPARFPQKGTLATIYSRVVSARRPLAEVVRQHFPWCAASLEPIATLFDAYSQRKAEQNLLDFEDLLLYWEALLDSTAGPAAREQVEAVLVDEYQDTNIVQAAILRKLACNELSVVGDDAQSIYSFRAATVENIRTFAEVFANTRVIKLEQNYRSTAPILNACNALLADTPPAFQKTLTSVRTGGSRPRLVTCLDEAEQSRLVADALLEAREAGLPLQRQAVLFRTAHHSDHLEVELARRNIPFVKFGGLRFVEAAHVKDLIAMLRVLENPRDQSAWFRVLCLLEGVGPASARRILHAIDQPALPDDAQADPLQRFIHDPPPVPPSARQQTKDLREALHACRDQAVSLAAQISRLAGFYEPVCHRVHDHAPARLKDLEQLEQIATGYTLRSAFIGELAIDPPNATGQLAGTPLLDEDWVNLSTIHSAKGCEWDAVHILHAADGNIPSDMATGDAAAIEEEQRLLYVAMTRARDSLSIYVPLRYYRKGRGLTDAHTWAQPSRFLTPGVRACFDLQGHDLPKDALGSGQGLQGSGAGVRAVDAQAIPRVRANLGALWKN